MVSKIQYQKFTLGDKLTEEQIAFFDRNGFIHFENVASSTEVNDIIQSTEDVQNMWISNDVKKINGVPIKYGHDENGNKIVHRFCFTSQYSDAVQSFVRNPRLQALKAL